MVNKKNCLLVTANESNLVPLRLSGLINDVVTPKYAFGRDRNGWGDSLALSLGHWEHRWSKPLDAFSRESESDFFLL